MKTLTIRNIDEELSSLLKRQALEKGCSLNACILGMLKQATGLTKKRFTERFHDLDELAGTWSEEEAREFDLAVKAFDEIDEDMWL